MPLTEQFLRTMSKLDEIEMFMIDYRDITMEYYNNYDATGTMGANQLMVNSTVTNASNATATAASTINNNSKLARSSTNNNTSMVSSAVESGSVSHKPQ
eukprot:gene34269-45967_t